MVSSITDMIIKIDIGLHEIGGIAAGEMTLFFSEVLRSSRMGYHRIIIPRNVAAWALSNLNLSDIDKAHLQRLRAEYTQLADQFNKSSIVMSVVSENLLEWRENRRLIVIGRELFINGNYLQGTVVILENGTTDGAIFNLILSHESKRVSFGKISYEIVNGGGSVTASELTRMVAATRAIVCICDTDLKVPGGSRSATYNSVMAAAAKLPLVGIAVGTPGGEVENFLPLPIISHLSGGTGASSCDILSKVMESQGQCRSADCFWLHFDLKRGLAGMIPHLNTEEKRSWISEKLGLSINELTNSYLPGFGDSIISLFLENNIAMAEFHRFSRSEYWIYHFSEWIHKILWVVCGRPESRTG